MAMNWLRRQKLSTWLLAVAVTGNLLLLALFWNHLDTPVDARPISAGPDIRDPVKVIANALGMDDEQRHRIADLHDWWRAASRECQDSLVLLKLDLAEALYAGEGNASVSGTTESIGRVQARLELFRFQYFRNVLAACSPSQRAELRPMIRDLFGRKPPADKSVIRKGKAAGGQPKKRADAIEPPVPSPPLPDTPPADHPPGAEEKLARYTARLGLTPEQATAVRNVLRGSREKGERLRKGTADERERRAEKERIRAGEDEDILQILHGDQKKEFERITRRRKKELPEK